MDLRPATRPVARLAVVVALVVATAPHAAPAHAAPAHAAGTCAAFGTIGQGKYWINNNFWGQDSGSGTQCVWDTHTSGSTIGWGTDWNWTGRPNAVKSFASSVLGWHWGWRLSGTGLPVRLSDNRSVRTGWTYRVTNTGAATMNVAYDLWLHTRPDPTWEHNPSDEVMIWLHRTGGAAPVGTRQATVRLGGASWDLYRGNIGWNVFSFVRTSNTSSVTLDLRDFLNDLSGRGWLPRDKYLTSVQAGTEVFVGQGRLDTDSYYTNVG